MVTHNVSISGATDDGDSSKVAQLTSSRSRTRNQSLASRFSVSTLSCLLELPLNFCVYAHSRQSVWLFWYLMSLTDCEHYECHTKHDKLL